MAPWLAWLPLERLSQPFKLIHHVPDEQADNNKVPRTGHCNGMFEQPTERVWQGVVSAVSNGSKGAPQTTVQGELTQCHVQQGGGSRNCWPKQPLSGGGGATERPCRSSAKFDKGATIDAGIEPMSHIRWGWSQIPRHPSPVFCGAPPKGPYYSSYPW
jgi:hypothetical protein